MTAMSESEAPRAADQHELFEQLHRRLDRIERLLQPAAAPAAPAWREPSEGEERWAVTVAILLAVALQLFLPARLTIGPHWLLPTLELALLAALAIAYPHRHLDRSSPVLRWLSLTLVAAISLANGWSAVNLVRELLRGAGASSALPLLATGGAVWATNVIAFALWYWEWDRGGPAARALGTKAYPDFLFPQMQQEGIASPAWRPYFLDYFYVAFTNATAFSPTDTMPLSAWAKLLMIAQAAVSLITVVLVVARAVGILQ